MAPKVRKPRSRPRYLSPVNMWKRGTVFLCCQSVQKGTTAWVHTVVPLRSAEIGDQPFAASRTGIIVPLVRFDCALNHTARANAAFL